jgi:Fic family protein
MADSVMKAIVEIKNKISVHYRRDYIMAKLAEKKLRLNERQEKFVRKFPLWKEKEINIAKYMEIYGVVHQTARTDLLDMVEKNILIKSKKGRALVFSLNPKF